MQNEINLTGSLGQDAVFKTVGDKQVVNLSVAESFYRGKDKENGTQWWNCSMWLTAGQVAYYQQRLKKGVQVVIRGFVFQDKVEKDGVTNVYVKINLTALEAHNIRIEAQQQQQATQGAQFDPNANYSSPQPQGGNDLPF